LSIGKFKFFKSLPGGEGGFFGFAEKDGRGITGNPEGIAFPLRGRWILPKAKDGRGITRQPGG